MISGSCHRRECQGRDWAGKSVHGLHPHKIRDVPQGTEVRSVQIYGLFQMLLQGKKIAVTLKHEDWGFNFFPDEDTRGAVQCHTCGSIEPCAGGQFLLLGWTNVPLRVRTFQLCRIRSKFSRLWKEEDSSCDAQCQTANERPAEQPAPAEHQQLLPSPTIASHRYQQVFHVTQSGHKAMEYDFTKRKG